MASFMIDSILSTKASPCHTEVDIEHEDDSSSSDEGLNLSIISETTEEKLAKEQTLNKISPDDDVVFIQDGKSKKKSLSDKQFPSYTSIIAQAILSSPNNKLSLGSIYDYISTHFPDFLKKGQGWRNCVRHNLSLSECFVKAGRARNGRGNYWGIHPRYQKNFSKGDYRKRRATHRSRQREFDYLLRFSKYQTCYDSFYSSENNLIENISKKATVTVAKKTEKTSFSIDSILSEQSRGDEIKQSFRNISKHSGYDNIYSTFGDTSIKNSYSESCMRRPQYSHFCNTTHMYFVSDLSSYSYSNVCSCK